MIMDFLILLFSRIYNLSFPLSTNDEERNIISNNLSRTNLVRLTNKKKKMDDDDETIYLISWFVCTGERVPEETNDRGGERQRRGQRGGEEDNGRPRQTR